MSFETTVSPINSVANTSHWVILLAAGESRRLGQPKQLLKKEGETLIRYMAQLALATAPQALVVVTPAGNPEITHAIADLTVEVVINPNPEQGMATSLSLAISKLVELIDNPLVQDQDDPYTEDYYKGDDARNSCLEPRPQSPSVLIMSVDQVCLTDHHLRRLLSEQISEQNPLTPVGITISHRSPIVTASEYHGVIGLPLVVQWSQLKAWQARLSGDKGLRHLIRALATEECQTVPLAELANDIDTPEQLAWSRQQGWLD